MYTTFFSVALFFGLAINAVFADIAVTTADIFAVCDFVSLFFYARSISLPSVQWLAGQYLLESRQSSLQRAPREL